MFFIASAGARVLCLLAKQLSSNPGLLESALSPCRALRTNLPLE